MASTAMAERIAAVKAHAKANYEAGWDVVVETMTDEDIAARIKGARGEKGAIAKLQKDVDLWNEAKANASSGEKPEDGDLVARQIGADDEPPVAEVAPVVVATPVVGMPGHKDGCKCVGCGIARKKASGEYKPSAAVAKKAASKPAAPKADKTPNACRCGCGNSTGSVFAVGHDARFASLLKRAYLAGEITKDDAQGQADAVSFNFGSKVKRMLTLADEQIAKAIKAEVAAVSA